MARRTTDRNSSALGPATAVALRRSLGTGPRRALAATALVLGVVGAAATSAGLPPAERTLAAVAGPAQLLMSVPLPLLGVLLAHDVRRAPRRAPLAPTLLAAVLLAVGAGILGSLLGALALLPVATGASAWRDAGAVVLGGVLVQVLAQLTGTGLGLLLRRVAVAAVATAALPLGLWFLLGLGPLRPLQDWLTPYAAARGLLSGRSGALEWAQWLTAALGWGAGLNALGAARLRRTTPERTPATRP
ncbi:hypothetical protein CLV92_101498 [Kineococcus xinjiangensis]|uniref:ABC-2 type transport system permease protein n=1 Tax=Kineococcus xinjiangensis TaxID=512762 RepID=A0A2S6IWR6_9ACTN|nr:hypothetical protein [Kineococcus xinjiangensis]PPK98797.1 hypothetical protein CLV92_101498 [Kineococcus xinjiangensis]